MTDKVVGFMLYGLPDGEESFLSPLELTEGEYVIFATPEGAEQEYNATLASVDLNWNEGEIMAVPIKMDVMNNIRIPSGVIAPKRKKEAEAK